MAGRFDVKLGRYTTYKWNICGNYEDLRYIYGSFFKIKAPATKSGLSDQRLFDTFLISMI